MKTADICAGPTGYQSTAGTSYLVETPAGILYRIFQIYAGSAYGFTKSSNGGLTWSPPTTIKASTSCLAGVWYDKWSGLSTGLIHILYEQDGTTALYYRTIDTENSDTLSTEVTVASFASTAINNARLTIARSRGGNVYALACVDNGVEGGFYKLLNANVPNGAWEAALTNNEALSSADQAILLPGWAADDQDMMCLFHDSSAGELSRQLYDDSGNTWGETSISGSIAFAQQATAWPHIAGTVDITNGQNLLLAWTDDDALNADLRCWKITESAITEVTNVVLNSTDDQGYAAIAIDTNTQNWYAFYGGKSDGSETYTTSMNIYCKISTDGGTTWGAETLVTRQSLVYDLRSVFCCPRIYRKWAVSWISNEGVDRQMITIPVGFPHSQSLLGI